MKGIVAGMALIGGLAAGPAFAGPSGSFGAWSVACSDGLDCTASTFREEGGDPGPRSLGFRRAAGAESGVRLDLTVGEARPRTGLSFRTDDGRTVEIAAAAVQPDDAGRMTIEDPAVAAELLPALRDAGSVALSFEAGGKPVEATFSLKGLVASLRFLDAAQYRDGTTQALEAKGRAAPRDPRTLPRDVASAADLPEPVRRAWAQGPQDCSDLGDFAWETIGFSTPVEDGRVYGLMCGSPGAYNAFHRFYHESADGAVEPVFLPDIGDEGPVVVQMAVNPDWNDREKVLVAFFKGRGLGDCGVYNRWRLDPASAGFVLLEMRAKGECDGDFDKGVEDWPALWPKGL